jgi:hypothetical protein
LWSCSASSSSGSSRRPPFSPESVVAEFAATCRAYRVAHIVGDRFGGMWPAERFAAHGIAYEPSARPKTELYMEFLVLLNSARVRLLDSARLLVQLCALERRTARGGRDSVDHPVNAHDDVANRTAGAVTLAAAQAASDAPILAANVAAESRGRVVDVREFELLGRGLY